MLGVVVWWVCKFVFVSKFIGILFDLVIYCIKIVSELIVVDNFDEMSFDV